MFDYTEIRAAILRQAVKDYKKALELRNYAERSKLERFFLGEWGQWLSDNNGEYIIDKCKREVRYGRS